MILRQVRNSRIPFVHVFSIEIGAKELRNIDLYQTSFLVSKVSEYGNNIRHLQDEF